MGPAIRFIGAIFWYIISLTIDIIYQRKTKSFREIWQNSVQLKNPFNAGKHAAHLGLLTLLGWFFLILTTVVLIFWRSRT